MEFMKLFISPTVIVTVTCSLLAGSFETASAKPFVEKINIQVANTEISGNITTENSVIGNIPCNKITVTLKEFIPTKPKSDRFNVPKEKTLVQQFSATGNTLAEGCSYNLRFRYDSRIIRAYRASSFQISARTSEISGTQAVSNPFPNNIDIQVFPLPAPPR